MGAGPSIAFFFPCVKFFLGKRIGEPECDPVCRAFLCPMGKVAVADGDITGRNARGEGTTGKNACVTLKMYNERLIHHPVNDDARRVERASRLASDRIGLGIVGSKEVLKHMAKEFGIKRDFFLDRRVLGQGEVVAAQDIEQRPHRLAAARVV